MDKLHTLADYLSIENESKIENPKNPKIEINKQDLIEIEEYGYYLGISEFKYTRFDMRFLNGEEPLYRNTIVFSFEMRKEAIESELGDEALRINANVYKEADCVVFLLSDFIRKKGYGTDPVHPFDARISITKVGQESGLGYIGKSGLLLTSAHGPRQKIGVIFVSASNLPFNKVNEHEWIKEFCDTCNNCLNHCVNDAIFLKDKDKCIAGSLGCTECISSCPFDKIGYQKVKEKFMS
ncbi:MAG: hypothetical protein Q4Q23_01595 [Methanobacteriaceae archaeon]|nr:hypothetical protein [Methanobacteriaceae archaeon]